MRFNGVAMLKTIIKPVVIFLLSVSFGYAAEIVKIPLFDGETLEGKLQLPTGDAKVGEIVIYVHGTGPGTYDNHRKFGTTELNYFDYFAEEFNRRGIGFFSYTKRGVEMGTDPPFYDKVDREKFRKTIPSIEVKDIGSMITFLRKTPRLKNAKVILLGWSEGTVLAAMAAEDRRNKVHALFLNGYLNVNMADIIKWQNTGGSAMVNLRLVFDKDKNGSVNKAEYESEDKRATAVRTGQLRGAPFEQLDVTKDEAITADDFFQLQKARYQTILDAYERGDEDWIWKNYFRVSIPWLKEHFALEANKDRLLRLKMPIYIFHGISDANCPVEGVYDLKESFDKAKKKNLHVNVFAGHNHDLNFVEWVMKKEMPAGIAKMFETAEVLNK
jgi:pimeloyl-ACP methyl ester carboxylesterase